ncbi:MAG: sulfite exporter TauE/SafE family protein, partial [Desulfovibrio sp.]|nr:sulfite exporter TauE/SafE family protein [Desulfovibrio sp.]
YDYDPLLSEVFISGVYVILLGFLGFYSLTDFFKLKRAGGKVDSHGHVEGASSHDQKKGLPATLQGMNIPPMITFDEDLYPGGKKISGVFVAACGAFVGLVAAIMGVGGGFITFPAFVYVLGVSSFTTVGTDILQIIFTAGFAAFTQYALYGYIFYTLAMGMLLGSLIGIQIGALTTKIVPGIYIRGFYATAILAGFANRLFALPPKLVKMKWVDLSPAMVSTIDMVGQWIFFIAVGIFGGWIIFTFLANLGKLREE